MNRVENYREILAYICDDINRSIRLTKFLKNELTKIYGKHTRRFRGEFYYYVWDVEFNGEKFSIYTANNKGTSIEIDAEPNKDKVSVIKEFLNQLDNQIQKLNIWESI